LQLDRCFRPQSLEQAKRFTRDRFPIARSRAQYYDSYAWG
jgi:hypothetical protein